jgi:hypothetical protein
MQPSQFDLFTTDKKQLADLSLFIAKKNTQQPKKQIR